MKNIHVLPTEKPSRLHLIENTLVLTGEYQNSVCDTDVHIYITSNEKIKEDVDQWYLDKFLNKPRNSSGSQYAEEQDVIILTTDRDLIKDGVQAIDDDPLEWFVRNPSCEQVKVEDYGDLYNFRYLILIPQEEPEPEAPESTQLSDTLFSIFSLDEIRTIIRHRQFRAMKTLQLSKEKQAEFSEVITKIEDMFDV